MKRKQLLKCLKRKDMQPLSLENGILEYRNSSFLRAMVSMSFLESPTLTICGRNIPEVLICSPTFLCLRTILLLILLSLLTIKRNLLPDLLNVLSILLKETRSSRFLYTCPTRCLMYRFLSLKNLKENQSREIGRAHV